VAEYYAQYLTVTAFAALGIALFAGMLGVSRLVQPRRQFAAKLMTYECGVDAVGEGWAQTHVRYYVFALLFVIFDVEAAFIFPWAAIMGGLGAAALIEMVVFIIILAVALVYAVRKGLLRWQ
jgi:NADH-quinone oxidoreductase subunit A